MNKTFNLLFYVKKTKINAAGEVNNSILSIPIFLQNILGYKFNRISAICHHLKSQKAFISDSGSVNRIIVSNKENFVDFVFKISFYD